MAYSPGYFTTSEFAKLCNVNKHTLFHYDELGIFSPAHKGENGYRYYSTAQIEVFGVISALKELDMPLADIKAYLDQRTPERFVSLLEQEEQALVKKINNLKQIRMLIRKRADLTREALRTDRGGITLRSCGDEYLVCTPAHVSDDERKVAISVADHMRYCDEHAIYSPHSIGTMMEQELAGQGSPEGYRYFYTQVERRPKNAPVFCKPAGQYLTAYHETGYDTVFEAYRRILSHARAQGLPLCGWFFEDTLLDELSVQGYEHYLLRISIRVGQG